MLHIIFIKLKVEVMYFIFIFISPSVTRFSVKKSVNQLIKKIKGLKVTNSFEITVFNFQFVVLSILFASR